MKQKQVFNMPKKKSGPPPPPPPPLSPPIVFRLRHGYTVRQTNLRRMSKNSSYSTNS